MTNSNFIVRGESLKTAASGGDKGSKRTRARTDDTQAVSTARSTGRETTAAPEITQQPGRNGAQQHRKKMSPVEVRMRAELGQMRRDGGMLCHTCILPVVFS